MNDLMQKLMISKQIMDRHDTMGRGQNGSGNYNTQISESTVPHSYNETPIPATYNIPQEFLQTTQSAQPKQVPMTEDRIKSSKLPDAIKKLMMEHPIQQAQSYQPTISNDIIEKAARLMGENKQITQTSQTVNTKQPQQSFGLSASDIKQIVRETVEEVLTENGLMVESTQKTNETMTIRVGKHIFEGKISKIKKTS
jgi:hypothetical protein